jgi:hypothetical protein
MARRSATESAAILEACRALSLTDEALKDGRAVLLRIVARLTAIVKRPGSGGVLAILGRGAWLE